MAVLITGKPVVALRKPAQARMADEGEQEQKPNVGAGPEHLNLQVKSQVRGNLHQQAAQKHTCQHTCRSMGCALSQAQAKRLSYASGRRYCSFQGQGHHTLQETHDSLLRSAVSCS